VTTDSELHDALRDLRRDADVEPAAPAVARARIAMRTALAEQRRPRRWFAPRDVTWRPWLALPTGFAVAAAAVLTAGWSSPAGSPLHAVRVAREWAQLSLPGADRRELLFDWSEASLRDAAAGVDTAASLSEASRLLTECRDYITPGSPTWTRWQRDEQTLDTLQSGSRTGSAPGDDREAPSTPQATADPSREGSGEPASGGDSSTSGGSGTESGSGGPGPSPGSSSGDGSGSSGSDGGSDGSDGGSSGGGSTSGGDGGTSVSGGSH